VQALVITFTFIHLAATRLYLNASASLLHQLRTDTGSIYTQHASNLSRHIYTTPSVFPHGLLRAFAFAPFLLLRRRSTKNIALRHSLRRIIRYSVRPIR
jgi:hypothetical protein